MSKIMQDYILPAEEKGLPIPPLDEREWWVHLDQDEEYIEEKERGHRETERTA